MKSKIPRKDTRKRFHTNSIAEANEKILNGEWQLEDVQLSLKEEPVIVLVESRGS